MQHFNLKSKFKAKGDQPRAIKQLVKNIKNNIRHQTLLGVTGSGKTFTMASVIEKTQRPALVISPNKTLAAQLYQEFKEFFPNNAVHYFVSYYDYYQPEAYIPQTDTYIEKDAKINEEIDRMRHAATQDLLSRQDTIVVASVSCIYNIGSPDHYQKTTLEIKSGQKMTRKDFLLHLISLGYERNDADLKPTTFRVRADIVEIFLVTGQEIIMVEFEENTIKTIQTKKSILDHRFHFLNSNLKIFPAHFWVGPKDKAQEIKSANGSAKQFNPLNIALENIKLELQEQLKKLKKENKLLEAQRLEQRTNYDIEMIQETGYCHGIENYSRHMEFREPDSPPYTLLDYFVYPHATPVKRDGVGVNPRITPAKQDNVGASNFLTFIDESHLTISQIGAMAIQDKMRKNMLIEHGFRLPSAIDNRPLRFEEFEQKTRQVIYVSATPNKYEKEKSKQNIIEQIIRPTGLLEPNIEIRPINPPKGKPNQIEDLVSEIRKVIKRKQRVLVITLTKRLAETISDYLTQEKISAQWLHSEVKTLERPKILNDLREGKYDVLIGINLLREGLDLPEVELVAILDADKEGFLRSEVTLIQTMGRASRHLTGRVILYADKITGSMKSAISEIERRRKIQLEYNKKNKINPSKIIKEIRKWQFAETKKEVSFEFGKVKDIKLLKKEMEKAAQLLDFERAAEIRDLIKKLNREI